MAFYVVLSTRPGASCFLQAPVLWTWRKTQVLSKSCTCLEQLHLAPGFSSCSQSLGEKNLLEVCLHLRSKDLQDNCHQKPHHLSPFTGWGPQLQENQEGRMLERALLTGTWLFLSGKSNPSGRRGLKRNCCRQHLEVGGLFSHQNTFLVHMCAQFGSDRNTEGIV